MVYASQIQQLHNYQGSCCAQIFVDSAQNYKKGARIILFISVSTITGKLNKQTQQPFITNVQKVKENKCFMFWRRQKTNKRWRTLAGLELQSHIYFQICPWTQQQ